MPGRGMVVNPRSSLIYPSFFGCSWPSSGKTLRCLLDFFDSKGFRQLSRTLAGKTTEQYHRPLRYLYLQIVENISHGLKGHKFASANILLALRITQYDANGKGNTIYLNIVVHNLQKRAIQRCDHVNNFTRRR